LRFNLRNPEIHDFFHVFKCNRRFFGSRLFEYENTQLENRECESSTWISDSFALCKVPEIERTVLTAAIITVASQTAPRAKNVFFAYNAPKITSVYYSNGPTTGGTLVTLFGEQFGLEDNALASRLGTSSLKFVIYMIIIYVALTPSYLNCWTVCSSLANGLVGCGTVLLWCRREIILFIGKNHKEDQ